MWAGTIIVTQDASVFLSMQFKADPYPIFR